MRDRLLLRKIFFIENISFLYCPKHAYNCSDGIVNYNLGMILIDFAISAAMPHMSFSKSKHSLRNLFIWVACHEPLSHSSHSQYSFPLNFLWISKSPTYKARVVCHYFIQESSIFSSGPIAFQAQSVMNFIPD